MTASMWLCEFFWCAIIRCSPDSRTVVYSQGDFVSEISAVSCVPLDPAKFFSNYITVSYWGSNVVEIFLLEAEVFVPVSKSSPLPALVRSVVLHNFGSDHSSKGIDHHPYVLAGLGDGSLVLLPWKDRQLKDKKIISLGQAPVSFSVCEVDKKRVIFAASNRATLVSLDKNRLRISPIMLKVSIPRSFYAVGKSLIGVSVVRKSLRFRA